MAVSWQSENDYRSCDVPKPSSGFAAKLPGQSRSFAAAIDRFGPTDVMTLMRQ